MAGWLYFTKPRFSKKGVNAMELLVSFWRAVAGSLEEFDDDILQLMMSSNDPVVKEFLISWSKEPWVIRKYLAGRMNYHALWKFHDRFYQKFLKLYWKAKEIKKLQDKEGGI
jgi:hypothetical protein